jgi:glutamate/aspartate transport system substrate-binding protein
MMMRKDDPSFKAVVDDAVAKLETSGEALKIYEKWFTKPIPPKKINLEFPPSDDLKKLYAEPNDKALQQEFASRIPEVPAARELKN